MAPPPPHDYKGKKSPCLIGLRRKEAKICKRKYSDISKLFVTHRQNGSIVSLKLCRNLCSCK